MTDTSLTAVSSAERHPQVRTDLPEGLDDRSLFNPEVAAKLQSLWLDHLRVVEEDHLRAIPGGVQPEAAPICPDLEFAPVRAASSEHEFREGSAMSKAMAVFSRNLLPFGIVTAIASLPTVLLFNGHEDVVRINPAAAGALALSGGLSALSQAIVLYGAFEDMRGQPVDLMRSFQHASRRFLPVIGVAFLSTVLAGLASLLLIIPGLILFTAWYVAIPACVVERLGPWTSLQRSAALTKGNRWKVARLIIVLAVITGIGEGLVAAVTAEAGMTIGLIANLIWSALVGAFSAILGVVIYHDLRVAKEGVDTDQIAAVFD